MDSIKTIETGFSGNRDKFSRVYARNRKFLN